MLKQSALNSNFLKEKYIHFFNEPAHMMNIRVFVEVVAVLTNVVELGVYGSVVLPSAAPTSLSEVTRKV